MRHWAEEVAKRYLEGRGFVTLAENYLVRGGEIDLVMRDRGEIVFVEVRQRRSGAHGLPAETLDDRKIRRLRRAAAIYLARMAGDGDVAVRFDAVLVQGGPERHRLEHMEGIA